MHVASSVTGALPEHCGPQGPESLGRLHRTAGHAEKAMTSNTLKARISDVPSSRSLFLLCPLRSH